VIAQKDTHSPLLTVIGVGIVLTALHVARDILVPVAIAILLSFLLAPLVRLLTRWHLPNAAAVLTTVLAAFSVLGMVGWLVSAQFVTLVDNLPKYHDNLRNKISSVLEPRDNVFSRAAESLDLLQREIQDETAEADQKRRPQSASPIAVAIQQPPPGPLQTLRQYAAPLLGPLGTAALSLIFVIFIMLQRDDLRDRFIKLVSGGNLNMATQAVDDAGRRISRYLLMHTIINVLYGLPVAIGLYFIGVPNAFLWGILATLLRFIPFIGAWISALFPISLAFAVDPGWTMPLLTIALIVVLELTSNNILEPWLYGSSTGISAVALIFAALLWTWIWGPVGLFLSTPLTVCLLVIGKNAPSMSFLNVILGTEPVLEPEAQLYQRMLAMDAESMLELSDRHLASSTLTEFYDRVLLPALVLAERDRYAGVLAEHRQEFIIRATRDLMETLEAQHVVDTGEAGDPCILCVPAKSSADDLVATMFGQVLRHAGIRCEMAPLGLVMSELEVMTRSDTVSLICICATPPSGVASTRRLCRQLNALAHPPRLFAAILGAQEGATAVKKRLGVEAPGLVATTFCDALMQIRKMRADSASTTSAPIPENEAERMAEVHRLCLLDTPPEELYDAVTRRLAETFDLPISLVSIIDSDRQFWKSQVGLPDDLAEARESCRSDSLCGHVVAQNAVMIIEDLALDKRFANNPFVKERGIRFYAGVPLCTRNGHAVGSLCVIDTKPRKITQEQTWLLTALAENLMQQAEKV
jgi:predicted PurR-regulated permease PerM